METLLEVFLSFTRIFLLMLVALITFFFAFILFSVTNNFLFEHFLPCIGVIALLVSLVPVGAMLYGVHIRRWFWHRAHHYNLIIFAVSFVIGFAMSLYPQCPMQGSLASQLLVSTTTGLISSLLAFIGMDFGVMTKHASYHLVLEKHRKKLTKPTKSATSKKKRK